MNESIWNDEHLTELRRAMVDAIDTWEEVRPPVDNLEAVLTEAQREKMTAAMIAEDAYFAAMRAADQML